jgi:hypothetical protein
MRSQPKRSFPPGQESAGRDLGHTLRDEFVELKGAFSDAGALAGAGTAAEVVSRFAKSGRLTDIPVNARRNAIRALRQLAVESRPC